MVHIPRPTTSYRNGDLLYLVHEGHVSGRVNVVEVHLEVVVSADLCVTMPVRGKKQTETCSKYDLKSTAQMKNWTELFREQMPMLLL